MVDNHYETLGISLSASQPDIAASYRRLVSECHPDLNGSDPTAKRRFVLVRQAYEVLSDPKRRERYDRQWAVHSSVPQHDRKDPARKDKETAATVHPMSQSTVTTSPPPPPSRGNVRHRIWAPAARQRRQSPLWRMQFAAALMMTAGVIGGIIVAAQARVKPTSPGEQHRTATQSDVTRTDSLVENKTGEPKSAEAISDIADAERDRETEMQRLASDGSTLADQFEAAGVPIPLAAHTFGNRQNSWDDSNDATRIPLPELHGAELQGATPFDSLDVPSAVLGSIDLPQAVLVSIDTPSAILVSIEDVIAVEDASIGEETADNGPFDLASKIGLAGDQPAYSQVNPAGNTTAQAWLKPHDRTLAKFRLGEDFLFGKNSRWNENVNASGDRSQDVSSKGPLGGRSFTDRLNMFSDNSQMRPARAMAQSLAARQRLEINANRRHSVLRQYQSLGRSFPNASNTARTYGSAGQFPGRSALQPSQHQTRTSLRRSISPSPPSPTRTSIYADE